MDTGANVKTLLELGSPSQLVLPTRQRPIAPELLYLMAKLAALMPFGKVAMFLDEVLPTGTQTHASMARDYTQRVGQRLARHQDTLPTAIPRAPAGDVVLGLDGGYVRSRQPRPERTFEVVVGKVLNDHGPATRFAFVREGARVAGRLSRACSANAARRRRRASPCSPTAMPTYARFSARRRRRTNPCWIVHLEPAARESS
jgi:hypothetical protein